MSSLELGPAERTEENGAKVAAAEKESVPVGLMDKNEDVDGGSRAGDHGALGALGAPRAGEPKEETPTGLGLENADTRESRGTQPSELSGLGPEADQARKGRPLPPFEAGEMASSITTLKPTQHGPSSCVSSYPDHDALTLRPMSYVDPTPSTPLGSNPPSRSSSSNPDRHSSRQATSTTVTVTAAAAAPSVESSPTQSEYDDKRYASEEDEADGGSRSEIQSIMDQFDDGGLGPDMEVMSPRLELASSGIRNPMPHPERASSLNVSEIEAGLRSSSQDRMLASLAKKPNRAAGASDDDDLGPPVPPKDAPFITSPSLSHPVTSPLQVSATSGASIPSTPLSPSTHSLLRPPLPEPEPEPALPFDFHRFLEQLRNKKADPVARYLKSFLFEFGKRQWMVHEQSKIIADFLHFIAGKMARCDVWCDVPDAEFDNAREGMEKLVMNRLYTQTFSPAIPPPQPIPGAKPRRKGGERPMGPGRRGQHQEDVERDEVVAQKIKIYSWVREAHLDIPPVGESGRRFLKLAQQELLKIRSYRAPRDKIICVLNCCKVIFGLLKHAKSDSSADSFMPLLIFVVLQASPDNLVSNVQYILRFRNQDKLGGEAGYYLSSLLGAIQFIENMDRTALTISDEEFERNVEAAVSAIAEKHKLESPAPPQQSLAEYSASSAPSFPPHHVQAAEDESSSSRAWRASTSTREARDLNSPDSSSDERAPIVGLLRTIQRPLSSIGRIFSDEPSVQSTTPPPPPPPPPQQQQQHLQHLQHLQQPQTSGQWALPQHQRPVSREGSVLHGQNEAAARPLSAGHRLSAQEAAARQASAEAAEAQRLHRAEHANVVETLAGMFPDLDKEIISDVVYQKQGRVGLAVDACLALSS